MSIKSFHSFIEQKLTERKERGLFRSLGKEPGSIDFSSNDYLGLARSKDLHNRIKSRADAMSSYLINGATGSRLLTGNNHYTEEVEEKLARIFRAESCLLFNSGYTANLAVISSLPQKDDTIIYDELSHACIKDGARLSLAKRYAFRHNDLNDLERKLKLSEGTIYVIVESIYSMDGDESPLADIAKLCEAYEAIVIVDEAHSTGVVGKNGAGLAVALGLENVIGVRVYTFGKAMGVHGACVAGSKSLIDYLINYSRPFIYTTALPAHSIISIDCAFDFVAKNGHNQEVLQRKIRQFKKNYAVRKSKSAIQTVITPGNDSVKQAAQFLQQKGLDVRPILSPTVPAGTERLRICLHTFNTDDEIELLTSSINELRNA